MGGSGNEGDLLSEKGDQKNCVEVGRKGKEQLSGSEGIMGP